MISPRTPLATSLVPPAPHPRLPRNTQPHRYSTAHHHSSSSKEGHTATAATASVLGSALAEGPHRPPSTAPAALTCSSPPLACLAAHRVFATVMCSLSAPEGRCRRSLCSSREWVVVEMAKAREEGEEEEGSEARVLLRSHLQTLGTSSYQRWTALRRRPHASSLSLALTQQRRPRRYPRGDGPRLRPPQAPPSVLFLS